MQRFLRRARDWLFADITLELIKNRVATTFLSLGPERVLTIYHGDQRVDFWLPDGAADWNQRKLLERLDFLEADQLKFLNSSYNLRDAHVLDIGANQGNHSLHWALVCGAKSVIAFEPGAHARAILEKNVILNNVGNVVDVRAYGLADVDAWLTVSDFRPNHMGAISFATATSGALECRRLDGLDVGTVDLVKIDVEGMSAQVIAGAIDTLNRLKPPVFVELKKNERTKSDQLLKSIGYHLKHELAGDNFIYEK